MSMAILGCGSNLKSSIVSTLLLIEMVGNGLGFLYSCCLSASKQDAPVVWPRPDQVYHVGQLVHALATVVGMHVHILCAKVAPLKKTITWKLDITSV